MASDDQRKHYEFLQAAVSRLAGNSFSIKGWAVALVAVLGGFAAKDSDPRYIFGLWLPALCFWGLDAYYLRQERLFRALYDDAIQPASKVPVYSMNTKAYQSKVNGIFKVAFSRTILLLHVPIFAFVLALSCYAVYRLTHVNAPAKRPVATESGGIPHQ